jgi:hypothetical protein
MYLLKCIKGRINSYVKLYAYCIEKPSRAVEKCVSARL